MDNKLILKSVIRRGALAVKVINVHLVKDAYRASYYIEGNLVP